ncbi:hypothetical protein KJ567_01950 [Candidatus Bipolaricaulota bacterium]|nr:hypothetical protein [Candidatus Bipolaricaulota bacterium]
MRLPERPEGLIGRLGQLTSDGGRAAARCASGTASSLLAFRHGYGGLIDGAAMPLDNRAAGGIIERGLDDPSQLAVGHVPAARGTAVSVDAIASRRLAALTRR